MSGLIQELKPSMADDLDPEQRRLRRQLLRQHHPDLGGDPELFRRVSRAYERTGRGAVAGPEIRFVRRSRGLARLAQWARRLPLLRRRRARRVQ